MHHTSYSAPDTTYTPCEITKFNHIVLTIHPLISEKEEEEEEKVASTLQELFISTINLQICILEAN